MLRDHVDWHGSFERYKADKARVYEHTQVACIFNTDHVDTLRMVENADVIEALARLVSAPLRCPPCRCSAWLRTSWWIEPS